MRAQTFPRCTVKHIGYDDSSKGFDYKTMSLMVEQQSLDITIGVWQEKDADDTGAGDQGLMFGYATDETKECMPLTLQLAHQMNKKIAELRRDEIKEAATEIKGAADRIKEAACSKKSRGKIFDIRELGGQLAPVWGDYIK